MDPIAGQPILVDQVYQRLRSAITSGLLPPGERVRQADLAQGLGVSRAPVSHALHLLKHERLVVESGRRGMFVAPIDPDQLRDHYQVRAALDSLAARLLAQRHVDKQVLPAEDRKLDAALSAGLRLSKRAALPQRVEADVAFHQTIYALCGNPTIAETLAPLWPHIQRAMNTVLQADEFRERAWLEHRHIVESIRSGDPDASAQAAWVHAANAGTETEARLRARLAA